MAERAEVGKLHATKHIGTDKQCQGISKKTGMRCERHVISLKAGTEEVFGTTCHIHGGERQKKRLKRELQERTLEKVTRKIGTPIEGDPGDFLMQQVWECMGNVAWLRERIRLLQTPSEINPMLTYPELFDDYPEATTRKKLSKSGKDSKSESFSLNPLEEGVVGPVRPGMYGPDHLGNLAPHVLWKMYSEERDRLARLIKLAADTGIQERQMRLGEQQTRFMAHVILSVIESPTVNLPAEQRALQRQIAANMMRDMNAALEGKIRELQAP